METAQHHADGGEKKAMPVPIEEWHQFVARYQKEAVENARQNAQIVEQVIQLRRENEETNKAIFAVAEKLNITLPEIAILKDHDKQRSGRDKAVFGAALIALGSLAGEIILKFFR